MLLNVALCFGQGSIKIHFNIFEGYYYFILLSCNNVFWNDIHIKWVHIRVKSYTPIHSNSHSKSRWSILKNIIFYYIFLKDWWDRYKAKTWNRFIKISCIIHRALDVLPPPSPPTLIMLHFLLKGNRKLYLYIFIEIGARNNFCIGVWKMF